MVAEKRISNGNPGNNAEYAEDLARRFTPEQISDAKTSLKNRGEPAPTFRDILNYLIINANS